MFSKTDIEKYFVAEKSESLFFLIVGIAALILSIWFFGFLKTNFYKGAAIPLLVIGLVEMVAGYSVYSRSDEQRMSNVYAYSMDPGKLKNEELPRMKKVNRNFVMYRWTEIIFLIIALTMIFLFRGDPAKEFWFGVGLTLAIQAALLLVADRFAAQRAIGYTKGIEEFVSSKPSERI